MRKRIAAWILLTLSAAILYFFSNGSVTLALFVALAAVLPLSYAVLRLTIDKTELSMREETSADGKKKFILNLKNTGVFPVTAIEAEAVCTNLRTGETDRQIISRSLGPYESRGVEIELNAAHAGCCVLSIGSAKIHDPLGIWSRQAGREMKTEIIVMPDIYDPRMASAGVAAMPESDMEAHRTRGAVSGDTIGIREYVPGDPVSNIHWKLSEKTDRLLVRELGNPQSDQYLIILDNTPDLSGDAAALDAVASVYASVIHALIRDGMICCAAWTDPESGRTVIKRLADERDEAEAANAWLAVPAAMPGAFAGIGRDIAGERYAHVVIVGSDIPANIDAIANGCQTTVLRHGESGSFTEGSLTVVGFETESYREDTAGIEI